MTDDLVTRRDEMQARFDALGGWDGISDMLQKAMDRIESDAATIAILKGQRDAYREIHQTDAATIARLEGERERLALAICGGEDAPGYANAQPVETLEKVARDNAAAAMWQIDRTMKAEAKLAALVEALEAMRMAVCGETGFAECVRRDSGKAYPWPALDAADEAARAALAAAKGAK